MYALDFQIVSHIRWNIGLANQRIGQVFNPRYLSVSVYLVQKNESSLSIEFSPLNVSLSPKIPSRKFLIIRTRMNSWRFYERDRCVTLYLVNNDDGCTVHPQEKRILRIRLSASAGIGGIQIPWQDCKQRHIGTTWSRERRTLFCVVQPRVFSRKLPHRRRPNVRDSDSQARWGA